MPKRCISVAPPLDPEKQAYALARFSRSADTFAESLKWIEDRDADSDKFLETYHFQYGHASIADLGHIAVSFENVSEAAAIEIEDEQLWDGQAKSTRYQDFSKCELVIPESLSDKPEALVYYNTFHMLLATYEKVHRSLVSHIELKNPRPESMTPVSYDRAIAARAFDSARYLLPLGIPTNIGQVTSIRTLTKQLQRLAASELPECRQISRELAAALSRPPRLGDVEYGTKPVAPTLARHSEPTWFQVGMKSKIDTFIKEYVSPSGMGFNYPVPASKSGVRLIHQNGSRSESDTILTLLLYPRSVDNFVNLRFTLDYDTAKSHEELMHGMKSFEELPRAYRIKPLLFEVATDIGSFRDLHRHRRCEQFWQQFTTLHGYDIPPEIEEIGGLTLDLFKRAMDMSHGAFDLLKDKGYAADCQYILPFATRMRCIFMMDFAEAEYITRLRSGIKCHFGYRQIAWEMGELIKKQYPFFAPLLRVTHPDVQDPLTR